MSGKDEIIFEDLHGVPDQSTVTVDLESDNDGIERVFVATDTDTDETVVDSQVTPPSKEADDGEGEGGDNKFEKRLDRERRAKLRERERASELERENRQLKQQLTENAKDRREANLKSLDDSIDATKRDLAAAKEEGDTTKEVDALDRLAELRSQRKAVEVSTPPESVDTGAEVSTRGADADLAKKWVERNKSWFRRPGFDRHNRVANEVDDEVYSQGFDPASPEYYEELDKRLRARLPGFFDDDDAAPPRADSSSDDDPPPRRKPDNTVAAVGGEDRGADSQLKSGKIELGPQDFAVMRNFGLDPKNPEHLKEFAASRRERLENEARGL
jgi:hypothetical protein